MIFTFSRLFKQIQEEEEDEVGCGVVVVVGGTY